MSCPMRLMLQSKWLHNPVPTENSFNKQSQLISHATGCSAGTILASLRLTTTD